MSNRKKRDERATRAAQMRQERERQEARRTRLITGAIVAVAVVMIVAVGVAVFANQGAGDGEAPTGATSEHGFVYSAETIDAEKTQEGKPVEVVFYEDFICPACGSWEAQVGSYVEEQAKQGLLSVEYRPVAFLDDQSATEYSTRAANAAACVFDSEGAETFHEFHDLMFENQPSEGTAGLSDSQLNELATQAGADDVQSCIEDGDFDDWVAAANDEASKNNVVSTPTIFVEGEELQGADENSVPTVQNLVDAVIAARAENTGS